jgi:hypothetical protein
MNSTKLSRIVKPDLTQSIEFVKAHRLNRGLSVWIGEATSHQGFKYRFGIKYHSPSVSPKFMKTSNISQKLVQI